MGTTIAVGNLKRGVGSTTLAVNLAVHLERSGVDVALLDCTSNSHIERWNYRRMARGKGKIAYCRVEPGGQVDIGGVECTLIDVGRSHDCIEPLLQVADIWLVPTSPSIYELDRTLQLFDLWHQAQGKGAASAVFAVLLVRSDAEQGELEHDARVRLALKEPGPVVLNQSLAQRSAWDETSLGHGLAELASLDAAVASAEFNAAIAELMTRCLLRLARPSRIATLRFVRITTTEPA